jgi:hypothetical protein
MTAATRPNRARARTLALRTAALVLALLALGPVSGGLTHLDVGVAVPTGSALAGADRTVGGVPLDEIIAAADANMK